MIKIYAIFFLSYILTFTLTYFGVERFRRWSLQRKLFDIPNERSSHSEPTPRGGGLVIVLVCLSVFFVYCLFFGIENYWAYFVGAIIVGFVSWLDDLFSVSSIWRFMAHGLAAFLAIWSFGFWESAYLPFYGEIFFGKFGAIITFFWIVWLINAYNFMDGIDGIAGAQAVTAGIGWFLVGILLNISSAGFYGGAIAVSGLGFLLHNWQPAKIFMGDVGSAFLGYTFALMPLLALREVGGHSETKMLLPILAIFLVLNFVFDSLWTILRRILRMEKIWQAHREHIYQKLVIVGFSHSFVASVYALISVLTVGLIILWLKFKQNTGDILFLIIFLQIFGLLAFSLTKKH